MKFSLNVERTRKRNRKHEEASIQVQLMKALGYMLPSNAIAFHVPNGGWRDKVEAANLRRQGVTAGVPDILIVYEGIVRGLELKSKGGRLSDSQVVLFPKLRAAGMRVEVARSLDEALLLIREMGIPLKAVESTKYDARDVFREAVRHRA